MKKLSQKKENFKKLNISRMKSFLYFTKYLNMWFYENAKMKTT